MATFRKRAGNWRAEIVRKGYPRQSRTFDSKAEAEAWAAVMESEMARGVFVDRTEAENTTLEEALDRYLLEVVPKKKGADQERVRIEAWKRDPLAQRSLASIRGADMAAWRDKRLSERRQPQKEGGEPGDRISPSTVRRELNMISHLFTIAIKEWGMESLTNPIEKIKMPAPAKARDRRLEGDEEAKLLDGCDRGPKWLGPMVRLALETGMRQGELLALGWEHVDHDRKTAHLVDTKNGESRNVPLSSKAIATLRKMAGLKDDADSQKPKVTKLLKGSLFSIKTMAVVHAFQRACARAEPPIIGLTFHDLRHEATSRLFEKGLAVEEVRAITGHKTLAMLMRYTHLRAEDLAKKLG